MAFAFSSKACQQLYSIPNVLATDSIHTEAVLYKKNDDAHVEQKSTKIPQVSQDRVSRRR